MSYEQSTYEQNAHHQYRWNEITSGKKVFWAISTFLVLFISVALVIHGRGVLQAEMASQAETSRREAEDRRRAEESRMAEARRASERQSFSNFVGNFYSIPNLRSSISGQGYIKGKVVVLDRKNRMIDLINDSLPSELRASTPDEVGTVVWLDWEEEFRFHYDYGGGIYGNAYRYNCKATIIDRSIPAKVGARSFIGSEPPRQHVISTYYGESHYGSKPFDEILNYLESLPRR